MAVSMWKYVWVRSTFLCGAKCNVNRQGSFDWVAALLFLHLGKLTKYSSIHCLILSNGQWIEFTEVGTIMSETGTKTWGLMQEH